MRQVVIHNFRNNYQTGTVAIFVFATQHRLLILHMMSIHKIRGRLTLMCQFQEWSLMCQFTIVLRDLAKLSEGKQVHARWLLSLQNTKESFDKVYKNNATRQLHIL